MSALASVDAAEPASSGSSFSLLGAEGARKSAEHRAHAAPGSVSAAGSVLSAATAAAAAASAGVRVTDGVALVLPVAGYRLPHPAFRGSTESRSQARSRARCPATACAAVRAAGLVSSEPSRSTILRSVSWMASKVLEFRSSERRVSNSSAFRSSARPATAAASDFEPAKERTASSAACRAASRMAFAASGNRLFDIVKARRDILEIRHWRVGRARCAKAGDLLPGCGSVRDRCRRPARPNCRDGRNPRVVLRDHGWRRRQPCCGPPAARNQ